MAALTIEEYKKQYEAAKAAGDAAGMQAANDGANAIRASQGVAPEYATADIANVAGGSSYTPLNATSAAGIDRNAYNNEVAKQQQYIAANPTAALPMTSEEKNANYADIINNTVRTGYYTQDAAAAQAAADKYGVAVTPTTYNGQSGWYLVDSAPRTVQEGSSGADEGLLDDYDYAIIQKLKQDFADAQAQYNAAVAAGDTAAAAAAQQAMNNAHLEAERIRTAYGYSGGQDGSLYITNGALGIGGSSGSGSDGSGGVGLSGAAGLTGYVNDYSAYLEQMYAAQKEAALAQLKNAYEQNINAINRAGEGVAEQYQTARNNTAGASEQAKRSFAEYAAANGLNSGTGGQAELARNVTLQNNMNTIDTAEAETIADLELQRANAETEYNNAIAQAEAEGNYQLAAALYQEKVRYDNAMMEAIQQEYQNALQQYQLQYQAQRDAVSDSQWQQQFAFQQQQYADSQQQYADSLAQNQQSALAEYGNAFMQQGIMPSAEMLAAMGITTQDAQSYIAALQAQQAASYSGGSSGGSSGSGSSSGNSMTLTTAKQAANAGVFNDQVLAVLRDNGYTDDMLEAIYGYTPEASDSGSPILSGTSSNSKTQPVTGMNDAYFTAMARSIAAGLEQGKAESVVNGLDGVWAQLSQTQKQTIQALLGQYGYQYTEG